VAIRRPKYSLSMVAFIDVLGFKDVVCGVKTEPQLKSAFERIRKVHDIFDTKPTRPFTAEANRAMGKKILALSDALVIAVDSHSPLSRTQGIVDAFDDELSLIGCNQALCATQGVFLRGGVSFGFFVDSSGIVMSDAMAKAYTIEEQVRVPLIAVDPDFYGKLTSHPGNKSYASGSRPVDWMFFEVMNFETKQVMHCLDYLWIGLDYSCGWRSREDQNRWKAAKTDIEKNQIMSESYTASQLDLLTAHKKAVEAELAKGHPEKIRMKYEYLKTYHNMIARRFGPAKTEHLIL